MNTLPKAVINQMSEYIVEQVGTEVVGKGLGKLAAPIKGRLPKRPSSADVPDDMKSYILNRIRQQWQRANPDAGPLAKQIGFNGMIREIGEERITEIVQGANEVFSARCLAITVMPLHRSINVSEWLEMLHKKRVTNLA